jgi:hypothetical protein
VFPETAPDEQTWDSFFRNRNQARPLRQCRIERFNISEIAADLHDPNWEKAFGRRIDKIGMSLLRYPSKSLTIVCIRLTKIE